MESLSVELVSMLWFAAAVIICQSLSVITSINLKRQTLHHVHNDEAATLSFHSSHDADIEWSIDGRWKLIAESTGSNFPAETDNRYTVHRIGRFRIISTGLLICFTSVKKEHFVERLGKHC